MIHMTDWIEFAVCIEGCEGGTSVRLPRAVAAKLGVESGDTLYLTELEFGDFVLSSREPEVQRQVVLGMRLMERYQETFETLAKT
jgi:hypothetical protein